MFLLTISKTKNNILKGDVEHEQQTTLKSIQRETENNFRFYFFLLRLLQRGGRTGKAKAFRRKWRSDFATVIYRYQLCHLNNKTCVINDAYHKVKSNCEWELLSGRPGASCARRLAPRLKKLFCFSCVTRMRNIFFASQETTYWNLTAENSPNAAAIRRITHYAN